MIKAKVFPVLYYSVKLNKVYYTDLYFQKSINGLKMLHFVF